ncbi:MAG: dihydrodipicolinate synthase family protein [Rhodospirillales bacterium]|jgi:4-hydroxy-tetrahydrodipicolinate synthase|nr:dihydrodipicolinate synthase family protein [Alphaproteobacteria bacterium]MDP6787789.1 dihydrodipicolinate synthase family protein [Rhodospirillales bacterium]MDP6882990.1 dihydrodipicolinate synthase family protein [Rhodospirillales bacterium]
MKQLEIGCYPAPVTPFSEKGDLMLDAFAEILRWHIASGAKGFLIAGDNGENWALSNDELRQVTEVAMREAKGRPIYVGAWAITEREAIERGQAAAEGGAYGLCIKPQHYVHAFAKAATADVVGRFEAMAKAVPLPVMVYNSPNRNNVSITHEQLSAILDVCPAEALKDNNYDLQHQTENCLLFHDKINILVSYSFFSLTGLLLGARGVIGSPFEYFGNPDRIFEFQNMAEQERRDLMQMAIDIKQVNSYLGVVPAPYKAGLNMIGLPAGYTRDPVRPLTDEEQAKLRAVLVKWGAPVVYAAPVRAAE